MDKKDIVFFCSVLEATERFGVVRTIDKNAPLLEILVSPYYEEELKELLNLMKKSISLKMLEVRND